MLVVEGTELAELLTKQVLVLLGISLGGEELMQLLLQLAFSEGDGLSRLKMINSKF